MNRRRSTPPTDQSLLESPGLARNGMAHQIARRSQARLLMAVVVFCLSAALTISRPLLAPQNTADDEVLNKLIDNYFAAYAGRDVEGLTRFWGEKSPDLAAAKIKLKELFALNSPEKTNLAIRNLK